MTFCPDCGGPLDTLFDLDALQDSKSAIHPGIKSMWRFRAFLPVAKGARIVSAGEGGTPLRSLSSYKGKVWVKDETRNPTGTFKDRGASLAVTSLLRFGIRNIVLSSEGNAGCSFALYAGMAGMRCLVFLPSQANPAKVELCAKLGARVSKVHGNIGEAGKSAEREASRARGYNASTFVTPYRHDGKGTMALEICETLGWRSPDWVVYPVGGGVGLVGMWKMFSILHKIGWVKRRPRFLAVQPSGCAPIVKAYNAEKRDVEEWKAPKTIAQGLKIPKPLAGRWILRTLRESKSIGITVTDNQIRASMRRLVREEGLLLEPSSAAGFAALPGLYEDGTIDSSDEVVAIATGSALKTLETLPRA